MTRNLLAVRRADELNAVRHNPIDQETLDQVGAIMRSVRERGESALRELGERFGEIGKGEPLVKNRAEMEAVAQSLPAGQIELLTRVASRIRSFAETQRSALSDVSQKVPGGMCGHTSVPVEIAGCYAPGGRYPLPSSVLMTVIPAKVAGVKEIWVASPKPTALTIAAAAIAGADYLVPLGGAHVVAALAYGVGKFARCDMIVGPGSRWVTAAKQLLTGQVGIDMLAGPSELLIVADRTASAREIAADLLAQSEHDPDALPMLVVLDGSLLAEVESELRAQLETLETREIAQRALTNGFCIVAKDIREAAEIANRLAPEHLELMVEDSGVSPMFRHYGALFIGSSSAEVIGDYGAGPNHVLPTSGTARFTSGLSVSTFLQTRTWIEISDRSAASELFADAVALAQLEGLPGHAAAASQRLKSGG